jgi:cytochrome c peroxidase
MKKIFAVLIIGMFLAAMAAFSSAATLTPQEELGKSIFFDQTLSLNANQACAACHSPEAGWTGPDLTINQHGAVYEGSIPGRFGNRKPPSSAYAPFSPVFFFVRQGGGMFFGGNFWDGRATGETLGDPAADQAQGPFLNPLEQALPNAAAVAGKVCISAYADMFKQICGTDACDPANANAAFDCIALSIAAYEMSPEVSAFSSKFDAHLAGKTKLTQKEKNGLALFKGKAKCERCHVNSGNMPLFTDFTYDNLGIPRNPENPFYSEPAFNPAGASWVDPGLGGFLITRQDYTPFADANYGKFKVPTLRNVGKKPSQDFVKAYGHNGYFKSLKGIVHFYNTRDVLPKCPGSFTEAEALAQKCWPLPEQALNMNTTDLGKLGLTSDEEASIVAFLKTLSDGWQ